MRQERAQKRQCATDAHFKSATVAHLVKFATLLPDISLSHVVGAEGQGTLKAIDFGRAILAARRRYR